MLLSNREKNAIIFREATVRIWMISYVFLCLYMVAFAMWTYLSNSLYSAEFIITKTEKSNEACILIVEKCNPWEKSCMKKYKTNGLILKGVVACFGYTQETVNVQNTEMKFFMRVKSKQLVHNKCQWICLKIQDKEV